MMRRPVLKKTLAVITADPTVGANCRSIDMADAMGWLK
jgi:hypothetical protein